MFTPKEVNADMSMSSPITKDKRLRVRSVVIFLTATLACVVMWFGYSLYKHFYPTTHNGLGCDTKDMTTATIFGYKNTAATQQAEMMKLVETPGSYRVQALVEGFVGAPVSARKYTAADFQGKHISTVVFTCGDGREVVAHSVHLKEFSNAILFTDGTSWHSQYGVGPLYEWYKKTSPSTQVDLNEVPKQGLPS